MDQCTDGDFCTAGFHLTAALPVVSSRVRTTSALVHYGPARRARGMSLVHWDESWSPLRPQRFLRHSSAKCVWDHEYLAAGLVRRRLSGAKTHVKGSIGVTRGHVTGYRNGGTPWRMSWTQTF